MEAHYITCSVWFAHADNEDYNRMHALQALTNNDYRQDIISNDLGEWIVNGQSPFALHGASIQMVVSQNT
jgi:hypothetical protein